MSPTNQGNIRQVSETWKTMFVSLASALIAGLLHPGNARADDVPSTMTLMNNTGGKGVCVVAYSVAKAPVGAFYLGTGGVWTAVPSNTDGDMNKLTVKAIRVDPAGTVVNTAPTDAPMLINAANFAFFYVPSDKPCGDISYTIKSPDGATVTKPLYPYNFALLEITIYLDLGKRHMVIDYSNVDTLAGSLEIAVTGNTGGSVKFGNQVTPLPSGSPPVTLSQAVTNFGTWLKSQPGYNDIPEIRMFLPLASGNVANSPYEPSLGPFISIQSPTQYLEAKCTKSTDGHLYPRVNGMECRENHFVHLQDPLNTYYEARIQDFFTKKSCVGVGHAQQCMKLMGDATYPYAETAWQVDDNNARCPIYLNQGNLGKNTAADNASLHLKYTGDFLPKEPAKPIPNPPDKTDIIICNPSDQVRFLVRDPDFPKVVQGDSDTKATITLSAAQGDQVKKLPNNGVGYNIGLAEVEWVGKITGITGNVVTADVQLRKDAWTQMTCTTTPCPKINPEFNTWFLSNVAFGTGTIAYETGTKIVFANDGVLAGYQDYYKTNGGNAGPSLSVIYGSIVRNIAGAFNHGIENCTGLPGTKVGDCANVTAKPSANYKSGAETTANANWVIETNWYPAKGFQNYYSQYLHTATVAARNNIAGANNLLWLPNARLDTDNGIAKSNQMQPMAMVYGFAYDENPTYLIDSGPNNIGKPYLAQVPTKFDPIPGSWSPITQLVVRVGP